MASPAPAIVAEALSKRFRVSRREGGLGAALRGLWAREWITVEAVRDLHFSVEPGARVGLLGRNGAGKTTTLKLLTGLVHPSGGRVEVLGERPFERRPEFLRRISLVMGQKRQLSWDLPALDTFELLRVAYGVERAHHRRRRDDLLERLQIAEVARRPVRQLSLGERMKCELVAALLHGPEVLFLDEPTIGMDLAMQARVRVLIAEECRAAGATLMLTSHAIEDVSALCDRLLVIDAGTLRYDGTPRELVQRYRPLRRVAAAVEPARLGALREGLARWQALRAPGAGLTVDEVRAAVALDVPAGLVPELLAQILAAGAPESLEVKDAPLDEALRALFSELEEGA